MSASVFSIDHGKSDALERKLLFDPLQLGVEHVLKVFVHVANGGQFNIYDHIRDIRFQKVLAHLCFIKLNHAFPLYTKGVEAGERAIGKQAFIEDVGHFLGPAGNTALHAGASRLGGVFVGHWPTRRGGRPFPGFAAAQS